MTLRIDRRLKPSISAVDILPRLQSGLQVKYDNSIYKVIGYLYVHEKIILRNPNQPDCEIIVEINKVKPLLRTMGSMTNQEKDRYEDLLEGVANHTTGVWEVTEWLNNNQFDYNDLISRGLAEKI